MTLKTEQRINQRSERRNDDSPFASSSSQAPTPLLSHVLNTIGSEIVSGIIHPEQKFTLQDICARFEISRTVAREAMRALEQLRMVSSSRRVGLTVLDISHWQVFDPQLIAWRLAHDKSRKAQLVSLNQMRLAIEPIAARMAASRATAQQASEIIELAQRLQELENAPSRIVGEELNTDLCFHAAVLNASGNEMFAALAPHLLAMVKGRSVFGSRKRDPIAGTPDLHLQLAHAIADGKANEAERISREILDEARASID